MEEVAIRLNELNAEALEEAQELLLQLSLDLGKAGIGDPYGLEPLRSQVIDAVAHFIGAAKILEEAKGDPRSEAEARTRIDASLKSHSRAENIVAFKMLRSLQIRSCALDTILGYIEKVGMNPVAEPPPAQPMDVASRVHRMVEGSTAKARVLRLQREMNEE